MATGASAPRSISCVSATTSEVSFDRVSDEADCLVRPASMKEHPTLFFRDDMITISVEDTLFRIPHFFLSQSSTYFAKMLAERASSIDIFQVTESDVTSPAFANLLYVLYPRQLGMPRVTSLSDWTDVLHLSTKWDFQAIRSIAIEEIFPLASPIDKIAIGRAYDILAWLSDAFIDLISREEDLTVAEARRIPLQDVVAIASGRRMGRSRAVKSHAELKKIAISLTSEEISQTASQSGQKSERPIYQSPARVDTYSTDEVERKMTRWLHMYDPSRSGASSLKKTRAASSIVAYLQNHPSHIPVFLRMALIQGRPALERSSWTNGRDSGNTYDGHITDLLKELSTSVRLQDHMFDTCLGLVDSWNDLGHLLSFEPPSPHSSMSLAELASWTKYLNFLALSSDCLDPKIFATFWLKMRDMSDHLFNISPRDACRSISSILTAMMDYPCTMAVALDMDDFCALLEDVREKNRHDPEVTSDLMNILNRLI